MKKDFSVLLIAFMVITFFVRFSAYDPETRRTFDEVLYGRLAFQIGSDPSEYNTVRMYKEGIESGREMPVYLNAPHFKHPPMFVNLILISYRMFGASLLSAMKISRTRR